VQSPPSSCLVAGYFLNKFLVNQPPHGIVREEDIQKMLSAQVHIGTRNSDSQMQDYIWRRRQVITM